MKKQHTKIQILSTQVSENEIRRGLPYYLSLEKNNPRSIEELYSLDDKILSESSKCSPPKKNSAYNQLKRREILSKRDKVDQEIVRKKSTLKTYKLTQQLKKISFNPKSFVNMKNLGSPKNLRISKKLIINSYNRHNLSNITKSVKSSPRSLGIKKDRSLNFRVNSSFLVTEIANETKMFKNLENQRMKAKSARNAFEGKKNKTLWNMHDYNILEIKKKIGRKESSRSGKRKMRKNLTQRCRDNLQKDFKNKLKNMKKKYSIPKKKAVYKNDEIMNKVLKKKDIPFTVRNLKRGKGSLEVLKNASSIQEFEPLQSCKNIYKQKYEEYRNFIGKILEEEEKPILTKMLSKEKLKRGIVDEFTKRGQFEAMIRTHKYVRKKPRVGKNILNFQNLASKVTKKVIDEGDQKAKIEKLMGSLMMIQETRDKYDSNVNYFFFNFFL